MAQSPDASFGAALGQALINAGRTQLWLAEQLPASPGQVSRWINNKAMPLTDTVFRIEQLLDADLSEAHSHSLGVGESYDVYVSAPLAELPTEQIEAHHSAVAKAVGAVKEIGVKVYWAGEEVTSRDHLGAPDFAARDGLGALATSGACLYLQFAELSDPSGALVELGFALGRRIKTTVIMRKGLSRPYLLEGFSGVGEKPDFLPEVHMYDVKDIDEAVRYIKRDGRQFLLPNKAPRR